MGELAFVCPLVVTRDHEIIDGYARWELAKRQNRSIVSCLECDLTKELALKFLIQLHKPSDGLNDFRRIELALDLEPYLRDKALFNQQEGGRNKGLSILTKAQRINVREEIARVARVAPANVDKVKCILANACSPLKESVRSGEVSINLADKWSHEPEANQQDRLRIYRIERGIGRKVGTLVAMARASVSAAIPDDKVIRFSDVLGLAQQLALTSPEKTNELGSIEIQLVPGPGHAIYMTREVLRDLMPPGGEP
jgi:hypothetical protein